MCKNGYVIEYGNSQKVFAEEGLYLTALECLKALGHRVKITQYVEAAQANSFPVLDAASFGYIIEYSQHGNPKSIQKVFVSADDLDTITEKLFKEGYHPQLTRWTNRVLEQQIGTDGKEELTQADGAANEEQIAELKTLCKTLMDKDETQKEFVQQIAMKTNDFTCISASACAELCKNLTEIIARYVEAVDSLYQ